MVKALTKKLLPVLLAFMMIMTVIPLGIFSASAATTVTVLDGKISVTGTSTTSVSGGTVTATAKGGLLNQTTNKLTIKNETADTAQISFDYSASNYKSFSQSSASGTYSVLLEGGASVTMSITGKGSITSNTATLKLSNFSFVVAKSSSNVTFDFDSSLGSVTVDGAAVSSGYVAEVPLSGAALVATPASGTTFLGWVNAENGAIISTAASFTLKPTSDMTVKPIFVNSASAPHFALGTTTSSSESLGLLGFGGSRTQYKVSTLTHIFDNLNTAGAAAASSTSKTMVLLNSSTLPAGDYTIPSGVTLLIPFDSANTMYTTAAYSVSYTEYKTPYAYRTLTMADGANITVNGAISVSGKHQQTNGAKVSGGSPTGAVGFIDMNEGSKITVNGSLYAYGYIVGSGNVIANSGAKVYENFQMMDFRGGDQSTQMKNKVFISSQYYVQNIEVPMTLYSGATEYSYTTVNMQRANWAASVGFIAKSNAMFNLTSGYVTKRYDGATDRLIVEANGNIQIAGVTMDLGSSDIDSKDYVLPINSNITVKVNSGSSISVAQDVAMLPGTQIIVEEGATCTVEKGYNIYLYDADDWGAYCGATNKTFIPITYAPGMKYTRTEADLVDALILVNGTVNATAGRVYSTSGGANVYSTGSGVANIAAGTNTVTYQITQAGDVNNSVYTPITVTPVKLKNADGSYIQTATDTYTYDGSKWVCTGHSYGEWETVTDATCTTSGLKQKVCVSCGDKVTEEIPVAGHTYDSVVTAPTCTDKGFTTHTCTVCGDTYTDSYVDAAHAYESVVTEPTCDAQGFTTHTCSACGHSYVDSYVDALGHSYGDWEIVTDATCTTAGLKQKECSVCGDKVTEEIPATDHTYDEVVTAPTCTEQGFTTYTCSVCGDSYVGSYVEALGHSYGEWEVVTDATCTTVGLKQKVCACGDKVTEEIPLVAHSYDAVVTDPTCTERGFTTYTCDSCGDSYKDNYVDALGHTYGDWEVVTDATCTTAGLKQKVCACGDKITEEIPVAAHAYNEVVTEPTCTEQGFTTHTCGACGDSYKDNYVDALGHNYGEWEVVTNATCTTAGLKQKVCACGDKVTEEIPVAAHAYNEVVTEPTCTEQGFTTYTCGACGDNYKDNYVDALGHSYSDEWTVDVEPTDLAEGSKSHHCANCDAVSDVTVVPALTNFIATVADGKATVTGYKGDIAGALSVPAELDGNTVVAIADKAFADNEGLTVIGIPGSVESISATAFDGCSGLVAVNYNGTIAGFENVENAIEGIRINYLGENIADIDEDGFVNANDLTYYIAYVLEGGELDEVQSYIYDANGDGNVNLVDLVRVKKYIAGKSNVLGHETAYETEEVVYSVAAVNSFYSAEVVTLSSAEPEISDYDTFIAYLGLLEEIAYAYKYKINPNADPINVVIKYIRTGVDRYNTGSWGIMAGYEDAKFAEFVQQVQNDNNADIPEEEWIYINSLKNINNFYLPNGDYVDMGHAFGTMDITYHNYGSVNHADVGGWAGDIVDLLSYVDTVSFTGDMEDMIAEITNKYLGSASSAAQSFGITDLLGDLDALYIMNELDVENYYYGDLTALMIEYFNTDLTLVDRADYFIKNRMDNITLRTSLRDKVYNAYMNNKVIATLEGTREFINKDLTNLRTACCYAFADYICKLAGDYVESVENEKYEVAATEHSTLAPGITQEIKQSITADGKSMVYYIATGDLNRDDVNLYANYHDNDPSKGWEMQRVLDQALAAQNKYGNPESDKYIENYNVIVATNGSGYNMSTGEPSGLLVMGGVEYHPINSSGFVGVLKNGKPVIGTTEEYRTIYKDQVAEGIAVFGYTLVKDGKIVNNSGSTRASRTAIGITKTGKIVMMVLDGRQEPFSCGGTLNEIAQIMLDAGCVNAVNLDGGGSTTYVAKQEGTNELAVVSRPSDGYARSVSTSFMLVSTAPSSTAFDHAVVESEADFLTVGSSLKVTAKGVSATGNSAQLPEGTHWEISDSSVATMDAEGNLTALKNGSVDVYLMLGDERLAFKTIEVVVPDTVFFTKTELNAVYGSKVELPIKATYMDKVVIINPNDVILTVDKNAGKFDGFAFIGNEASGIKLANITISLPGNPEKVFTLAVSLFKQGEAAFDFNQATGGDRQLAWYREISNSTTIDNITYYALDATEEMVTSYTVAIDMSAIETPDKLDELTYMLPGADAQGVTAWHFLCQLAERVSPLTTITTTINFDKNFDVDYTDITLLNEYFLLTGTLFDEENNALILNLKWKDQTAAIDVENANPICILSGIKLTPKADAAWDADSKIAVCHTGNVEYDIYLRASALYTFAQKPENQEKYGIHDYANPDDVNDKGGHLKSTYKEFRDTYNLVAALKNGWEAVDGGYVYYEEGKKLVGLNIIDGIYYMFDENGINVGKTKYTGLFFDEQVNAYRYAKLGVIMGGWQTIGDDWYYFYEDTKVAQTGIGYHFSGVKYVFDKTGKLTSGVWIENSNGRRYYYGPSWYAQRWAQIDGNSYYFNKSGYCVTGNHVVDDGTLIHFIACVFGNDGKLLYYPNTTGVFKAAEGLYYLVDGVVQVDLGLIKIEVDGKTQYIYISTTGKMAVGKCTVWINNNLVPYASEQYFDENGFMEYDDTIKNGIINENGTLYYYIDNVMQVNLGLILIEVDGVEKYIYVRTAGQLAVGQYTVWLNHNIVPYASVQTFDANGFMVIGSDFHTHKYGSWMVDIAATCEEAGARHKECTVCGSKIREAIASLGHKYSSKVVAPTCTAQGYTTHTCANCGDSYNTDFIDTLGHSYSSVVTAPTCTDKGFTTHTCANCGDTYVDSYVNAKGHSYGNWITREAATCEEAGLEYRVCACGHEETRVVNATGHTYGSWFTRTEASCEGEGLEYRVCACGAEETRVVSAKGHSYSNEWTIDVNPTDLNKGEKSHHCVNCDSRIDITVIPANSKFNANVSENGGLVVTGKSEEIVGACVIPEQLDGKNITTIGNNAFAEQNRMTVVGIPGTVTEISASAFYGCVSLKAINFNGTIAQWKAINIAANAIPANVRINYLGEKVGDLNQDGSVNATDLTYLVSYVLEGGELDEVQSYIYDANGDGNVNLVDLVRVKKCLAGKSDILGHATAYETVWTNEVVVYEDRKDN